MEKILLEYEKHHHQKLEKLLNDDLKQYQQLYDVVRKNFTGFDGLLPTLEDIINDAPGFLLDQTVKPEDLVFSGLPISRKKALEMIEFPQGYTNIIETAKSVKNALKSHVVDHDDYPSLSIENIQNTDNKLSITNQYLEGIKDEFCAYTKNENQTNAANAINNILEQIAILKKLGISPTSETNLDALGISLAGEVPKLERSIVTRLR